MAAKIICHDVPEIETGDIRGPVKHSTKELKEAFAKIEEDEAKKMVKLLPTEIRNVFADYLVDAKSEDEEGHMVEISDKVEAFIKTTLEMRDNQFEYEQTYIKQKKMIEEKFDDESVKYFLSVLHPDLLNNKIVQI